MAVKRFYPSLPFYRSSDRILLTQAFLAIQAHLEPIEARSLAPRHASHGLLLNRLFLTNPALTFIGRQPIEPSTLLRFQLK